MEEKKKPPVQSHSAPKFVRHGMAMDSAEHLFAAFPISGGNRKLDWKDQDGLYQKVSPIR